MASDPQPPTGPANAGDLREDATRERERGADAQPLALVEEELIRHEERIARDVAAERPEHDMPPTRESRSGLPIWLFMVALLGFSLVLVWQHRQAGALQARIAGLEQKLDAANQLVDAHQAHLQEVRGGVSDLSERMKGLSVLVELDPADRLDQAPAAPVAPLTPPTP